MNNGGTMTEKRIKVLCALNTIAQGNLRKKVATYDIAQQAGMSVLATHNILMSMSDGDWSDRYVRKFNIPNASAQGGAYKYGWEITLAGFRIAKSVSK
jgi:hypothetical protein